MRLINGYAYLCVSFVKEMQHLASIPLPQRERERNSISEGREWRQWNIIKAALTPVTA